MSEQAQVSTNTFKPGHLYCAGLEEDGFLRFEGMYWYGGDDRWYHDDISEAFDVAHPWYDVMAEAEGYFNAEIAALVAEVAKARGEA